ncbi:SDR family NAD(P)-dependent oxidoreductase [Thiomicrorhabdus arctica]|uniref:SDR family NAD(P)-dependent oxidoreductase n=1 Tax=Thiomicrorhabdus arctica TaxID=131540 RepID=UPI00036DEC80|nr:SDR family NAD(P)-dependent oxidoreductase [Thiomicrorhabdus arctica]
MQTYLVTGAAQGLGKALSTQLVEKGHQVILLDKELKALNALYDELNSDLVALYPIDLLGANIDHYQALQDTITEEYGQLDGVILNAAILPAFTPLEQFDYMQWYEVLHTNLNANFHLIQNTLELLKKSDNGKLLAVLDQNINLYPAYYGAYGVAKAGLEQLMITVATEHKNTNLEVYNAKLEAFATESRGRLFPGENPLNLPSAERIAKRILAHLLEDKTHPTIQCL